MMEKFPLRETQNNEGSNMSLFIQLLWLVLLLLSYETSMFLQSLFQ